MSKKMTVYSKQTGEILRTLDVPENYMPVDDADTGYLDGAHSDLAHYVPDGVLQARPKLNLSISDLAVSGIPAGATVLINGSALPVSVTEFSLAQSDLLPGRVVRVRVIAWPFQTENFELSVLEGGTQ